MESEGQRNPTAVLTSMVNRRNKLQDELRNIERQVYELETSYLQDSSHFGNVLKGFEGFLSSTKSTNNLKRSKKFQPEDRLFSLSSVTSPAAEELGVGREEGRSEFGPGRPKGALGSSGPGKPKRGRFGPRDGRRTRPLSEPDLDDEDDPDSNLR